MKKCLLIINPMAGQKKIESKLMQIIQELNNNGYAVSVFVTSKNENAFYAIESHLADEELVICAGGDGTLSQTVDGIIKNNKSVNIGYIPCGSTNDFASSLGLNKDIRCALSNIINGNQYKYDVGSFNGVLNEEIINSSFVYIASFGLFTASSYNTSQDLKNNFGHFAYMLNGMSELLDTKTYRVAVKVDREEFSGEYVFGMVANTLSVGGVVKLNTEDVDLSDGLFEVLLVKKPNTLVEFNEIINGMVSKNFNSSVFDYRKGAHIDFQFQEPVTWALDGEESIQTNKFHIDNMSQKLCLLK